MRPKLKKVSEQVIVITGASSGIGLTTAQMAAEQGARVVLNARSEDDLRKACDEIRRKGGLATYCVGDVADADAMEALARTAIDEFGRIDTWVNDAGISIYGRLIDVPLADKRRLFDVNFWGVVHGCRSAVRQMRARGGTIINIGSEVSDRAIPIQGIYSASKHAVKAYTDALRMELEEAAIPIAVTLVKPGATNTMFIDHARSYMDADPDLPSPVYAPEEVAHAILRCAEHQTREVTVGGVTKLNVMMGMVAPRLTDYYMERKMFDAQKKDYWTGRPDALDEPTHDGSRRGSTQAHELKRATMTRAALSDAGRMLPFVAVGGVLAALGARAMRRDD
jgi:short-subunit dehydrogenase